MPKVLVLFAGAERSAATLAESAAAGAKAVRFTEVEIRSIALQEATNGSPHKSLESPDEIEQYDGVILSDSGGGSPAMETLLGEWRRADAGAFTNTVFAVVGPTDDVLLGRVTGLGGILVTVARREGDPDARANALGGRVAKVVEWVRHALSHEHSHHHHAH